MRHLICLIALLGVVACGGVPDSAPPAAPVLPVLGDVDVAEGTASQSAIGVADDPDAVLQDDAADAVVAELQTPAPARRRGLLGRVFGGREPVSVAPVVVDTPVADGPLVPLPDGAAEGIPQLTDAATPQEAPLPASAPAAVAAAEAREATPRRGVFGFLRGNEGARVRNAAAPAPRRPGRGPAAGAPDFEEVAFGTSLAYGRVARVCGVAPGRLGKVVSQYPEKGRAVYRIHDTAPGTKASRTMYVTGFSDGCARQITASLAIFGDFALHEQLRYGLPADTIPYSKTDAAYETLKSRRCRVGKGKPCATNLDRMTRTGTFLSFYERYTGSPRWKNMLLHDGEVLAFDTLGG